MRIAGISNFYVPTINNRLDLSNVKRAELEVSDTPEPHPKNVYTYEGGFGTYSNKSKGENIENLLKILKNIKSKECEWQSDTMTLPTGEAFEFKYINSVNLRKGNMIDMQI